MSLFKHEEIYWFTSPTELRRIADKMEKIWHSTNLVDSTLVEKVTAKGLDLLIHLDQSKTSRNV